MPSKIEICNLALSQIRADNINSLNEGSLEADACRAVYDEARWFVLRDAPWPFATETAALALLDTNHPDGWAYVYDYPSTCLKLLKVGPSGYFRPTRTRGVLNPYEFRPYYDPPAYYPPLEYRVARVNSRRIILTDVDAAYAQTIVDVVDPTEFDAQFTQALMWYIAAQVAVPIIGVERGRVLRNDALSMYRALIDQATAAAKNEASSIPPADSEFITFR